MQNVDFSAFPSLAHLLVSQSMTVRPKYDPELLGCLLG